MRRLWTIVLLLAAAGCASEDAGDREQVLDVMEQARAALAEGDGGAACDLLTDAGRERAVAFDDFGTCEETVRKARESDPSSVEDAERARLGEPTIDGDRASVDIEVDEYVTINVSLALTADGWRIDDSEAVPVGEN